MKWSWSSGIPEQPENPVPLVCSFSGTIGKFRIVQQQNNRVEVHGNNLHFPLLWTQQNANYSTEARPCSFVTAQFETSLWSVFTHVTSSHIGLRKQKKIEFNSRRISLVHHHRRHFFFFGYTNMAAVTSRETLSCCLHFGAILVNAIDSEGPTGKCWNF